MNLNHATPSCTPLDSQPNPTRRRLIAGAGLGLTLGWAQQSHAQSLVPNLRLLVGFPAGAGLDPVARQIADLLRGSYASTVIVDNKAGAGGRIALEALKTAPPDGSSIILTPGSTLFLYPHIYKKLSYDPVNDFSPITTVYNLKMGLVVGPACPAKTLAEYISFVKKDPKNSSYASPSQGSIPHFIGSVFAKASGLDLTHVPYKGSAPAWLDLLSGQVPAYFTPIGADAIKRHESGEARVLAVADPARTRLLPQVPTFAELGFPSVVIQEWVGMYTTGKTPAATVNALNAAIRKTLQSPEVMQLTARSQTEPIPSTAAALAALQNTDTERWGGIVKASGFRPED